MTKEKVIIDFFTWFSGRDLNRLADLLSEQARLFFPKAQPIQGKDRILKFLGILFRQYPELTFQIQRMVIQENQAAVHWQNRGTTRKGEPYENEGVTWMQFRDGRIDYLSDFFKDTEKF
jgi:ketosteroid isomerase-like protein